MNGLRLSQADTKKPDMKGWSDYRKADYEKNSTSSENALEQIK